MFHSQQESVQTCSNKVMMLNLDILPVFLFSDAPVSTQGKLLMSDLIMISFSLTDRFVGDLLVRGTKQNLVRIRTISCGIGNCYFLTCANCNLN